MARPRKDHELDVARRAVEEAMRLLETQQAKGLTMADVAGAVGCRAPALYNHFRNREALLRAVHDAGFERLYAEKLAVASRTAGDAFVRLREGGIAYLSFALENPELYRLMFDPPAVAGLEGNPFETDLGMKLLGFLRSSIAACQDEGFLPTHNPDLIAFTLWSTVHGAAQLILSGRVPSDSCDQRTLAAAAVDTVMALIAETRPLPAAAPRR